MGAARVGRHLHVMERTEKGQGERRARPEEVAAAEELVHEVEQEAKLPAHVTGRDALFCVMCALRQRLSAGEAEYLVKALPDPVQPLTRDCPRRHAERAEVFGCEGLLARVSGQLHVARDEAERITAEVFAIVRGWLSPELIRHVASQLPPDIRVLWAPPLEPAVAPDDANRVVIARRVLEAIRNSGALPPETTELEAFAVVLCTLTRRLGGGEARDLYQSLPPALQPALDPCVFGRPERPQAFDRDELMSMIADDLQCDPEQAEDIAVAVFTAVIPAISPKQVNDLASQLPLDLKGLWIDAAGAARVPVTLH
jgi:uncharacterized protein (DUF2267 family)